jgi:hypothetical protein
VFLGCLYSSSGLPSISTIKRSSNFIHPYKNLQSIPGYVEEEKKVSDIKSGAILIGIGVGVVLLGKLGLDATVVWASGLLVASLGLALLAVGIYTEKKNAKDNV